MELFAQKPDEVFTPRSPTVNKSMYVDRSELESRLGDLVTGSKHVIIHGESGNGKTWLYKKVFSEKRVPYSVVNLANAVRFRSIANAMKDKITKTKGDEKELSQIVIDTEAGIAPGGVGVTVTSQKIFEVVEKDPLLALMMLIRKGAGSRPGFIVFDNFEAVLNDVDLVKELASILILLDDEDYAKNKVKICIVGVPSEIRDYLTKQTAMQSISNRLIELPEVARLSVDQANSLLKKGLSELQKFKIDNAEAVFSRIQWATDRIAQYLHELGLEVSQLAIRNNRRIDSVLVEKAEKRWYDGSISSVRQTVDSNMNARETKAGRRNQVLFALGCVKTEDFKYSDIESIVRSEFPDTTEGVELNIFQRLSELEKSEHPIIKRVPKGDAYRIINPKIKIAIRVMLRKTNGRVERVPLIT